MRHSQVTAVVLQLMGADAVPPTVLALVAPFLFEIERVDIEVSDVVLRATLTEAAAGLPLHVDELYERLPDTGRAELSAIEFGKLLDRLIAARLATVNAGGIRLEPPGRRLPLAQIEHRVRGCHRPTAGSPSRSS